MTFSLVVIYHFLQVGLSAKSKLCEKNVRNAKRKVIPNLIRDLISETKIPNQVRNDG